MSYEYCNSATNKFLLWQQVPPNPTPTTTRSSVPITTIEMQSVLNSVTLSILTVATINKSRRGLIWSMLMLDTFVTANIPTIIIPTPKPFNKKNQNGESLLWRLTAWIAFFIFYSPVCDLSIEIQGV